MTPLRWRMLNDSERGLALTAVAAACVWAALVFAYGGLHFDDFVNIAESRGALAPEGWTGLADGDRWQPLKRGTYDLLARVAGLTFWPYIVVLMGAHIAMAAGVASCARAIWGARGITLMAGVVALSSLNLSGFSIAYVATLHGVASVALAAWSVSFALRAALERRARVVRLGIAAVAAAGACLYKETGVATPAVAAFAIWLARRERPVTTSQVARAVGPAVAGLLLYLLLRVMIGVPLIPARGRYSGVDIWPVLRNAAGILMHVMPWAFAALAGSIGIGWRASRRLREDLATLAIASLTAVFPTLLLPWQSPNFLYAALPVAALGTAGIARRAVTPSRANVAVALLIVIALAGMTVSAARRGAHLWGPYAKTSLSQWLTYPHAGGRVVWFDADSREPYGGLVRTIGPGDRLTHALRLVSGAPRIVADVCISVQVSTPYAAEPGDELYLHTAGRLEPISSPPPGNWYCNLP